MTSFAHQAAQIDLAALARYLEGRLPGFKGPIEAREDADRAVEPDVPAGLPAAATCCARSRRASC